MKKLLLILALVTPVGMIRAEPYPVQYRKAVLVQHRCYRLIKFGLEHYPVGINGYCVVLLKACGYFLAILLNPLIILQLFSLQK